MVHEVLEHLNLSTSLETGRTDGFIAVDATLGLGGHAAQILATHPNARVIGFDRDPGALKLAETRLAEYGSRLTTIHANFADMAEHLPREAGQIDAILMDLGISSWQLASRGFSFQEDAPLDFRMNPDDDRTAADVLRESDERELADLLYELGEERRSRRIAKAIIEAGREAPIDTTQRLAKVIASAARRQGRIHPATKSFQALRIAVNDELPSLTRGLAAAESVLKPGGRLAVISFHSLEDRLVKVHLRQSDRLLRVNKKVIQPTRDEVRRNPRARSAKLRISEHL